MSNNAEDETIADNSLFIEMVKDCVENRQTLPILVLVAEGTAKIQTMHQALPMVSLEDLLAQIENMVRYTLLSQTPGSPDSYQITDLGTEFKDILVDIEKLKEKYV